jgi:hypothetical protein
MSVIMQFCTPNTGKMAAAVIADPDIIRRHEGA